MPTVESPSEFLLAILEGFLDGIIVLSDQRQPLYINSTAHHLCQRLSPKQSTNSVPPAIWQVCESLIESRELHSEKSVVMESEVDDGEMTLRVRVQWLSIAGFNQPCLLIRLQDEKQAVQTLAIAESQNWHLTERESQVWMLRRAGYSRKQIAAELYISEDTVKKHLGNVRAKRQIHLDEEEWQLNHSHSAKHLCSA